MDVLIEEEETLENFPSFSLKNFSQALMRTRVVVTFQFSQEVSTSSRAFRTKTTGTRQSLPSTSAITETLMNRVSCHFAPVHRVSSPKALSVKSQAAPRRPSAMSYRNLTQSLRPTRNFHRPPVLTSLTTWKCTKRCS